MTLVGFALAAAFAAVGTVQTPDHVPGEILVKYRGPSISRMEHAQVGAQIVGNLPDVKIQRLRFTQGVDLQEALDFYRAQPNVEFAELNYLARTMQVHPNDANYRNQWGLAKISAPAGWTSGTGSTQNIIAIIDTGVDLDHPDLQGKIVPGYDFVNKDGDADDDQGHGTHCAGIAAANTNNRIGIAGVDWNARIMPVKVLGASGTGNYADVASGIVWATNNGAKVISMSLGSSAHSETLRDAINYAASKNVVLVASAGNSASTAANYPAYYEPVIAVASTDANDQLSWLSNYGSWVDVAAPGSNILSTFPGGIYVSKSGTSMAAPHVAGLATLVWTKLGPSASAASVRRQIEATCDNVGSFTVHGRINVASAVARNPGGSTITTKYPPKSISVVRGTVKAGSVTSLAGSDNNRLDVQSVLNNGSHVINFESRFTGIDAMRGIVDVTVTLESQMSGNGDVRVYLLNYQTGGFEHVGTQAAKTSDATMKFRVTSDPGRYISSTGQLSVALRRWGPMHPYNLRTDVVRALVTTNR